MKESEIAAFDKPVLVAAVKLAQKYKLVGPAGGWPEWLAAQDPANKFNDPKRHTAERLVAYLSSLDNQLPDPKHLDKKLVKPQKLLRTALPWIQQTIAEDQSLTDAIAAAKSAGDSEKANVLSLIQSTRSHPRFKQKYEFASYEGAWARTNGLPQDDPSQPLVLLGIDCEMCVSAESEKELIQVAVVDQQGNTLIKELVKPKSRILDYKSHVTGITAEQLEGVTTRRKHIAARIQELLTPGTVLVGHSLHYDLEALKLDHQPVIDTAMLFSYQNLSNATPSLTHLAQQLLGRTLRGAPIQNHQTLHHHPQQQQQQLCGQQQQQQQQQQCGQQQQQQPHDSVEDASTAVALVQRELGRLAKGEGPTRPLQPPGDKVDKSDQAKLCIHKLPPDTTPAALHAAFAAAVCKGAAAAAAANSAAVAAAAAAVGSAAVQEVGSAGFKGHQVLLVFKHPGVANDAFGALPGVMLTDSLGRPSNRLQLPGSSGHVVVRKMVCHNGLAYGKDKATDRGAKQNKSVKPSKSIVGSESLLTQRRGPKNVSKKHKYKMKRKRLGDLELGKQQQQQQQQRNGSGKRNVEQKRADGQMVAGMAARKKQKQQVVSS